MRRSKERVTALGFFETVDVTQKPGSEDDKIVLQVEVKEKATGTFQVGLGFSNVENFIFTAQVSQNNFLGWGQSVSASAQLSGPAIAHPALLLRPVLPGHQLSAVRGLLPGAAPTTTASSATPPAAASRWATTFIDDLMAHHRLHARVRGRGGRPGPGLGAAGQPVPQRRHQRRAPVALLRPARQPPVPLARLHPLRLGGVRPAASWAAASCFTRYTAYSRLYFPLPLGLVFKTNATVGYIQQLESDKPLPISELYYLGGINTVRGYFLRSLSPTLLVPRSDSPDATVVEFRIGGNKQLILNLELEVPVFEKAGIRGVLFYDAGNAFARNERFFQDRQDKRAARPLPLRGLRVPLVLARWAPALRVGLPAHQAAGRRALSLRVHHRQLLLISDKASHPVRRMPLPRGC